MKNYTNQLLETFKKRKVHSIFRDSIWGADLDNMQVHYKVIRFLLYVIKIFCKCA